MEFNYFKEFFTLAKEKNYTKAADKLFLSQSVLTKHIQKLETELGFELFIRTSPLTLTPAGDYLLHELQNEYDTFIDVIEKARHVNEGLAGTLSLGLANYSKGTYVPDIKIFQKQYPHIRTNMVIKDQNDLFTALLNDEVDIATLYTINYPSNRMLDQFARMPIVKGQMGILVNKENNVFKKRTSVSIRELKNMRYILVNNTYYRAIHNSIESLAQKYGVKFNNPVVVPSLEDGLLYVLMYGGAMFVPGTESESSYGPEFKKIKIEEDDITYTRYYLWKMSNMNTSIVKYITVARDRRASDISKKIIAQMNTI